MSDFSSCPALSRLGAQLRPGRRISLRQLTSDGPSDFVGLILALDADSLLAEDRHGRQHRIAYATIRLARAVPTVARGRNPHHAPTELLTALVQDAWLRPEGGDADPQIWVARLCDLVDHLDSAAVEAAPDRATCGDSRVLVNGEWAAAQLASVDDLDALAAWAARRNARNIVLTSSAAPQRLRELGLAHR